MSDQPQWYLSDYSYRGLLQNRRDVTCAEILSAIVHQDPDGDCLFAVSETTVSMRHRALLKLEEVREVTQTHGQHTLKLLGIELILRRHRRGCIQSARLVHSAAHILVQGCRPTISRRQPGTVSTYTDVKTRRHKHYQAGQRST